MKMYRMDLWTKQGKERVGKIERVALTFIQHRAYKRQLMGSCCIQKELSSALCDEQRGGMRGAGGREVQEGGLYMHTYS